MFKTTRLRSKPGRTAPEAAAYASSRKPLSGLDSSVQARGLSRSLGEECRTSAQPVRRQLAFSARTGRARALARPPPWLVLAVVALGISAAPLDTSVNIAFPAITAAFGNDVSAIQWVIICNVLTYAGLMPGLGRLADIVGHKRVFVTGLAWSAGALVLCGVAETFGWLLAARVLQGAGNAFLLSCGPALATLSFPERDRGRVLGWYTTGFAAALMLGPAVGGVLVDLWGWPSVFWFRVPLVLAAAVLVVLLVPDPGHATPDEPFDLRGALGLGAGLAAALLALNQGPRLGWASVLVFAGAALVALWFVRHELRTAHPVIDVRLFRIRPFAAANIAHVLMNVGAFMIYLLTPYYLVRIMGAGTALAGLLLAVSPLGMIVASPIAGHLLRYAGSFRLGVAGLALLATALCAIAMLPAGVGAVALVAVFLAHGCGQGLFQVASIDFVMGTIPRSRQGVAGSLNMVTRTVGVVTVASTGTLLFASLGGETGNEEAFLHAYRLTFLAAAAVVILAIAVLGAARHATPSPARPRSRPRSRTRPPR